jgi:hypothetical protein
MATSDEELLATVQIEPTMPTICIKQSARQVIGQHIEVLAMSFKDRILINVVQTGKLGQIVHTPPVSSNSC